MAGGLHYPKKLSRSLPYDGEKVWKTGDWFGAVYHGGRRCCAVLSPYEVSPLAMSFPRLIESDRTPFPTIGRLGQALWRLRTKKRVVLDGTIGIVDGDGEYTWKNTKGRHPHPGSTLFCDDLYSLTAFEAGKGTKTYLERRKRLSKLLAKVDPEYEDWLVFRMYSRIDSRDAFRRLKRRAAKEGAGFILRRDAPYCAGKSGNVLVGDVE